MFGQLRWWSVALAGVAGALVRWALTSSDGSWPLGVLAANTVGAALLGWLVGRDGVGDRHLDADLAVGLCGGLTTMSAFVVGVGSMVRTGDHLGAVTFLVASLALGLGAATFGLRLGRT